MTLVTTVDWSSAADRALIAPRLDGLRALHVGFGPGFWGGELARRGADVEIVDIRDSPDNNAPVGTFPLPQSAEAFDLVVTESILQFLREPVAALDAVRRVAGRTVVMNEAIELSASLLSPRNPSARLAEAGTGRWWLPNRAAVLAMAGSAGLAVERATRPFFLKAAPSTDRPVLNGIGGVFNAADREQIVLARRGVAHVSVRCRA